MTALDNDPRTDSDDTPFFLNGNFAPVFDELTDVNLKVTGSIPPSLSGRYLRNGSNPKSGTAGHWFFGDGMVHGVRLDGGKAEWYRNRYVQTTKLEKGLEATDPAAMFDPTASAANTHVLAHAGRIWALEEGHLPYELSPELDTLGYDDFGGKLDDRLHRPPEAVPRDRRTALLRLLAAAAVPHVSRPRRERGARPLGSDRGPAGHDDARLHDHPRPRDLHGPAGGLQPREPGGSARVGRQLRRPHRHRAPHGHQRRHSLVRGRSLLRVPPLERLRRRRQGHLRCRPSRDRCGGVRWSRARRRSSIAGRST